MLIIVYFARTNKYLLVILHKIGCSSEKNTSILFSRIAQSLHKIGCSSEKNTAFFSLGLHNLCIK